MTFGVRNGIVRGRFGFRTGASSEVSCRGCRLGCFMVRVIVCGDPSGDIVYVSRKLSALCGKSESFAFALLLHPPFNTENAGTLSAEVKFPLKTYFAAQQAPDDELLRKANLFWVGPASTVQDSGLTIMLVAAGYDEPPSDSVALPPEISSALRECGAHGCNFRGIDILVSSSVPLGISSKTISSDVAATSIIARVALQAKPRYHFASADDYVALAPFVVPSAVHSTRFITLAPANRGKGKQWLYAADVTPLRGMTASEHAGCRIYPEISAPYCSNRFSSTAESVRGTNQSSCKEIGKWMGGVSQRETRAGNKESDEIFTGTCSRKRQRSASHERKMSTVVDERCWFCLGNEKELHLVVWVGHDFYVAAAKGGIVPQHVLIVPIGHVYNSLDGCLTSDMHKELDNIKDGIRKFYEKEVDGCKPLFFERAVRTRGGAEQMHMHIQCIPIKRDAVDGAVQVAMATAERAGIQLDEIHGDCVSALRGEFEKGTKASASTDGSEQFFWAELPDGTCVIQKIENDNIIGDWSDGNNTRESELKGQQKTEGGYSDSERDDGTGCVVIDRGGGSRSSNCRKEGKEMRYPMQFGREIAATLLNCPHRIDWKRCVGHPREEQWASEKLRDSFQEYAPK